MQQATPRRSALSRRGRQPPPAQQPAAGRVPQDAHDLLTKTRARPVPARVLARQPCQRTRRSAAERGFPRRAPRRGAADYGSEGRGFESLPARFPINPLTCGFLAGGRWWRSSLWQTPSWRASFREARIQRAATAQAGRGRRRPDHPRRRPCWAAASSPSREWSGRQDVDPWRLHVGVDDPDPLTANCQKGGEIRGGVGLPVPPKRPPLAISVPTTRTPERCSAA